MQAGIESMAEARRRRRKPVTSSGFDPLAAEIAETLIRQGGSAHRTVVIEQIVRKRTDASDEAASALRERIMETFDAHRNEGVGLRPDGLFRLPFGPESHRWALTQEAHSFFYLNGVA